MASSPNYLDPLTLAKLQGLRLRARHIVEGYVAGLHRSPFRGYSIEFAEHREYAPGDDLKHLDWRVYGRTDKYYLKQYEDETNLACCLALDASESMFYRSSAEGLSKWEYAQCLAAALALIVLEQQDSIGLAVFDSEIRHFVRPAGGSPQLPLILHSLEQAKPGPNTAAGPVFHELAQRLGKRGVVIVLSDMFDNVPKLFTGLSHLRSRRHDVAVLQVLDAAELDFPFRQWTRFDGLEGAADLNVDPAAIRQAYLKEFDRFRQSISSGCRTLGIEHRLMRTDQPLDLALASFLRARAAR